MICSGCPGAVWFTVPGLLLCPLGLSLLYTKYICLSRGIYKFIWFIFAVQVRILPCFLHGQISINVCSIDTLIQSTIQEQYLPTKQAVFRTFHLFSCFRGYFFMPRTTQKQNFVAFINVNGVIWSKCVRCPWTAQEWPVYAQALPRCPGTGAGGGGMQQPEAAGVSPPTTEIRKKPPPLSKIPQK